ncbi:MAG TPA: hypothetical protein VGJ74_00330 [Burkholderiales bacterium]
MKPSQGRVGQSTRDPGETLLRTRIDALFRRLPMLCGFVVEEDLLLSHVAISAWPGYTAGPDLYSDIADALAELVAERADAAELLRGRTFARQLH